MPTENIVKPLNIIKTMSNMNRHPQNDIPFEVRMKYIIQAYRKDKDKLERLQRYAEGLEEENVSLQKQLD